MPVLRPFATATIVAALVSCSSSSTSSNGGGPGAAAGVVPPDLRDVERTGEGAVGTTLAKDWTHAASVLKVLTSVWNRYRPHGAADGAPPDALAAIDHAIADLGAAIQAQDVEKGANAANAVGLAVPAIFAIYHPDIPIEVVRMDAYFRQLGIDARFGHWDRVASDLAALESDWAASKSATAARAPTCSRVGGTATVVRDIDDSLANARTASGGQDGATIAKESDAGAKEIDTLELLFDCPADGVTPTKGLGAACQADGDCEAAQACDPRDHRCHPDGSHAKIGTPCSTTIDCGDDPRAACDEEAADGYPGGYCGMEPCDDVQTCPVGSTCVSLSGETPACFRSCASNADCRTAEGYVCQLFAATSFGPGNQACAFPCKLDADCNAGLTCDVASGICKP